jgi:hypothetical protein
VALIGLTHRRLGRLPENINIEVEDMTIKQQDRILFCRRQQSGELYKEPLLATYRPDPLKKIRQSKNDKTTSNLTIFFSTGGNS